MNKKISKTTNYVIKVNEEVMNSFDTLGKARNYVKSLQVTTNEEVKVDIVKEVLQHFLVNSYTAKPVIALVAENLDENLAQQLHK